MKNKDFLISVIVNCHNGEKYLNDCINSIINQSYKNWELIFWDNSSTDNTSKLIKKFSDKRIKYFYSQKFEKLYKARNLAVKKTKGEFICFLDIDDLYDKNFIQKHLKKITEENCDVVYSKYIINDEIKKKQHINEKKDLPAGNITNFLLKKYLIGISATLLRKKIFDNLEFNSEYQIIGDFDFFLRLSLIKNFYPLQEAFLTYRHRKDNFTNKNLNIHIEEKRDWIKKNKKFFKANHNFIYLRISILKLKIKKIFNI